MDHPIHWFEIPVSDMSRAVPFYEAMLSTKLRLENYGPPGQEMAVFVTADQDAVGGCLFFGPHLQPSKQGTLVYLSAEPSIDACIARARTAGGLIVTEKTALPPGLGYIAHIEDSEGNRIGLHSLA